MKIHALMIIGLLLAISLAGCTSDDSTSEEDEADESSSVDIVGMAFSPSELTISVGDTVIWTNKDSATHTATDDNGTFDSGNLASGESFSFTFDTAGTYTYHCNIHTSMVATIIVE